MRPVCCCDAGDEVRDARTVLRDAYAMFARDARVAVCHMRRILLMRNGNKADAGQRKKIVCIHVSGTDDAERILHPLSNQRFHERLRRRHVNLAGLLAHIFYFGHGVHGDS